MLSTAHKNERRALFTLAIPMILSNITVPLLGLIDTAVIGHLPHAYFLGGTAVGSMIITAIIWFCGFLRMSTSGLAAQAFGSNNQQQMLLVLSRGLIVALTIGLLLVALQQPFIDGALWLAGGSNEVQLYARQYSEIRVWGFPAALANLVVLGWLLGMHKAKQAMWVIILTNVVNLCLDLLFVLGFNWQVQGVALATLIAEYSGLLLGLWLIRASIHKQMGALRSALADIKQQIFARSQLLAYMQLNRDIVIRTICLELCFIFITFEGAKLGDTVVATNAILMNFILLISFGLDGIAFGAEARVGKAKGAKDLLGLKIAVKVAMVYNLIFAIFYSLFFLLFGKQFILLLSDIEPVTQLAEQFLPWITLLPILACWCYLFDGIYIGLTQGRVMRNSMLIATFGCFFPVWWLFSSLGNHAIWAALSIFMVVRGLTLMWHFKHYNADLIKDL
ncbi:MATE family efflux transporter [Colwelliaceae bacterium BS250]